MEWRRDTIAKGWKGHYYMLHRLGGLWYLEFSPCEVVRVHKNCFGMIFPAIPSRCSINMKPNSYAIPMHDVADENGNYNVCKHHMNPSGQPARPAA